MNKRLEFKWGLRDWKSVDCLISKERTESENLDLAVQSIFDVLTHEQKKKAVELMGWDVREVEMEVESVEGTK